MKVKGQRRVEVVVDGVWREGGGIKKVVSLWVREEEHNKNIKKNTTRHK